MKKANFGKIVLGVFLTSLFASSSLVAFQEFAGETHCQSWPNKTCRTIEQEVGNEIIIYKIPGTVWHHVD